ncbi:MAG TPA: sugar phosphate isomerase/epimerase, partial [Chthoniobacterales bacterium]
MSIYHPSIEGAQHGAKSLGEFLVYAKKSGASGAQPSNFMLENGGKFRSAKEIKDAFEANGLLLDGISGHCPFWVHTSAWTGSPTVKPFVPAEIAGKPTAAIEAWAEDYLLGLLDLSAELSVKILPMFWGIAFGWELATGYPWGFWAGPGYDLLAEGQERFVTKTARI